LSEEDTTDVQTKPVSSERDVLSDERGEKKRCRESLALRRPAPARKPRTTLPKSSRKINLVDTGKKEAPRQAGPQNPELCEQPGARVDTEIEIGQPEWTYFLTKFADFLKI